MTDIDKIKEIRLIKKSEMEISDYKRVEDLIRGIKDINLEYEGENILYIVTRGDYYKNIFDDSGSFVGRTSNSLKYNQTIKLIDLILDKGFDKSNGSGLYDAPILFNVEYPLLFEYLCEKGFNPNERLKGAYQGYPYFVLHHDFLWETYEVAKKYGFDRNVPIGDGNLKVIHLIFRNFIEFPAGTLDNICKEFKDEINIPDPENGLPPLLQFITSQDYSEFSYNDVKTILKNGADPTFKTIKDIVKYERQIESGMTAYEIVQSDTPVSSDSKKWRAKLLDLLKEYENKH